ncbi:unnamed protein product [Caenorhabditis bovis]|uniref:Uncharacterized protein n=1 Tax=Caenorhabditis bovis TaxID=2654633 RepID=A0A8S1ESH4_9PELO|nr:unnamed protein product [Caenorhabditis bovis]
MRSIIAILSLLLALCAISTTSAGVVGFQPRYFRYRKWDPTHDFYDDDEFNRQLRARPFSPMAYRMRMHN